MDIEAFVRQVVDGEIPAFSQVTLENASILADRLKAEADRHFRIDPAVCLRCGDTITEIGKSANNLQIVALGATVRSDAFRILHRVHEAWEALDYASELYRQLGDEIWWARTCIGRVAMCVELNRVEAALQEADTAREIFRKYQDYEKLIKLETNIAAVFNFLAQFPAAIEKCQQVLQALEATQETDSSKRIIIYYILGHAHQGLGNLREALSWYEQSRQLMAASGEKLGVAMVDLNMINIAQAQGRHKKALQLLHETIDVLAQHISLDSGKEMMHVIEGYLFLNRYSDARDLARKVIQAHPADHENDDLALILLLLAKAESAAGDFNDAYLHLQQAENIFFDLNAVAWLGMVYLYRAQVSLAKGDRHSARQSAIAAAEQFIQNGQKISHLIAILQIIRMDIADEKIEIALQMAREVGQMAREFQMPHLSYEAHLLQGKIAEQEGRSNRALRHYQVATGIMERIQRSLVLTSRSEFLADKQESVQSLVRTNLALGRTEAAFGALERAKAQVWLSYLGQLDHLRWLDNDPQTQPLIEELGRLREEHHWYYRIAHDQVFREQQPATLPPEEAAQEALIRERRLRDLTEQLYLHTNVEDLAAASVVPMQDIQGCLNDETALVAYYSDERSLWAFVLDSRGLEVYPLLESVSSVETLVDKWQNNINRALRTEPGSSDVLHDYAKRLAKRLYDVLMRPFARRLSRIRRLIVVPYGVLHYLPFQLLHDDEGYLIEQAEVAILPTASLLTRQSPRQPRRTLALAYSWDGRLQHSQEEAGRVVERFGGQLCSEGDASRSILSAAPCQVLHISAHGQHRIDQPNFSYIQLADGPLYTDDLFQHDLRYELVTLSACETGRSRAAAGDELIGLGRGFLFAGAGALIASLWRVDEARTLELMDELYFQLDSGASKAAALRAAQLKLMRANPGLHPAFWGAFQLIGNADPLSIN